MNLNPKTHGESANPVSSVPIRLPSWDDGNSVINLWNVVGGGIAFNMDAPPDKQPATHQI